MHDAGRGLAAVRPRNPFRRGLATSLITLISLSVAAAVGCNGHSSAQDVHESNLRLVAVLYSQYSSAHGGKSPQDSNDFRSFVQSLGPGVLERAGISGIDQLFISHRDGRPFAIKYQSKNWNLENTIAYEQTGANGVRCVASELGAVSEVPEEQFAQRLNAVK